MKDSIDAIAKLRKVRDQLPHLPRALAIVWSAARGWIALWAVLLVVQGLLPVATVYLTRSLVDSLAAAVAAKSAAWENINIVLVLVGLLAGVMLLNQLLSSASSWIRSTQSELVQDHISALIHDKSIAVDLAFYEMPEYYDHLHRARSDASYRPMALVDSLGRLLQDGITLVAMAAVLIPYGVWLPVALLVSTLPAFFVVLRYAQRQRALQLGTTGDQRRAWYYDWLLTSPENAADLRLLEFGEHFKAAFQATRAKLRLERLRLARDQTLAQTGAGSIALLVTGAAMALMVWRALQGQATLGDLALFYQAFNQGQGLMRSLMENIGEIYRNILFYDSLLGKWFDGGTELSVGEWQRIAIARGLVRESPIVVLDEPTSAMDPWTKVEWLQKLREIVVGRTTVIITH